MGSIDIPELAGLPLDQKDAVEKALEAVNLLKKAAMNHDDVTDLRALIKEKRDAALKGDRQAIMAIRSYRDELFKVLSSIALNFGLSIASIAGGVVLFKSAVTLGCTAVGLCLGVGGAITIIIGAITIALAAWSGGQALYAIFEAAHGK